MYISIDEYKRQTVKGAIANAGVDPKEIGSVGISSQRGTFFAIDENW